MKTADEIKIWICEICGTDLSDGFYKEEETGKIICEECLLESDMVTTDTITNYYLEGEYIGNNVDSIEDVIDALCDTYNYSKI